MGVARGAPLRVAQEAPAAVRGVAGAGAAARLEAERADRAPVL